MRGWSVQSEATVRGLVLVLVLVPVPVPVSALAALAPVLVVSSASAVPSASGVSVNSPSATPVKLLNGLVSPATL